MAITDSEVISLCNESLGAIGASSIVSGGTSKNHVYCETFYANCRDEILACHKWNFAKKRAYAIQTTNPLFGPDNAFTVPTDSIRVWKIDDDADAEFEVENGLIITDHGDSPSDWATATAYIVGQPVTQSDVTYVCATAHTSDDFDTDNGAGYWTSQSGDYKVLPVEYVYQHTTIANWPKYVRQCLKLRLILDLAPAIKQNEEAAVNFQAMLYGSRKTLGMLSQAKSFDAQESGGGQFSTNTFIDSRTQ